MPRGGFSYKWGFLRIPDSFSVIVFSPNSYVEFLTHSKQNVTLFEERIFTKLK